MNAINEAFIINRVLNFLVIKNLLESVAIKIKPKNEVMNKPNGRYINESTLNSWSIVIGVKPKETQSIADIIVSINPILKSIVFSTSNNSNDKDVLIIKTPKVR